jgi:hypothetical protein
VTPRLAARIEVSALIRRVEGEGGTAAVLARGDGDAGAILLQLAEKGRFRGLYGRSVTASGAYRWQPVGPGISEDTQTVDAYIQRRRATDGDLWVVELDVADAERFTAQLVADG